LGERHGIEKATSCEEGNHKITLLGGQMRTLTQEHEWTTESKERAREEQIESGGEQEKSMRRVRGKQEESKRRPRKVQEESAR
jgi:hypothetical protein